MANEALIKQLKRKRGGLKAQVTCLENFLNSYNEDIDFTFFKDKFEHASDILLKFQSIQSELESIVEDDDIENEYTERITFEERFNYIMGKAKRVITDSARSTQQRETNHISMPTQRDLNDDILTNNLLPINRNTNVANQDSFVKLPTMNLPQFSGSYEAWPGFCDAFTSAIHNNPHFSNSQKLIYLRSCLTGKASEKIESLDTTSANYVVAWSILEKYYDDPIAVINNRIKALFELPICSKSTSNAIGEILDNASKHYRALKALNKPFLEAFPIYCIMSKLDDQTRLKWKEITQGNESPTMEELLEFLHTRQKILETNKIEVKTQKFEIRNSNNSSQSRYLQKYSTSQTNRPTFSHASQINPFCNLCKGPHFTNTCIKLVNAPVQERHAIVRSSHLCFNCLSSKHEIQDCISRHCKKCNGKHHTLLHRDEKDQNRIVNSNLASLGVSTFSEVLLSTAIVHLIDDNGYPQACRVLLDSGSQSNFMTTRMADKLRLHKNKIDIPVSGINKIVSRIKYSVKTALQSRHNNFTADLTFLLLPNITEFSPSQHFRIKQLNIPSKINLADPKFNIPCEIDALIGAELFYKLLCIGQFSVADGSMNLQKTHLGWIVSGKIANNKLSTKVICNLSMKSLNDRVNKFWEIEEGPHEKLLSPEENACEKHYTENTRRDSITGRYTVKLPFKDNISKLGDSHTNALKRFYSLERSLIKNHELKQQYVEFIKEYENLGHMTEVKSPSITEGYYLPHHAVIKQSSLTTKLRVVFDGSAKSSTGFSLNDTLMVGPTIQDDLFSLIIRFRSYAYVLTADIAKMYRQISVHSDDRKYQRILWRQNIIEPVKTFELGTVTYGTSSASFLATRSLHQLANDQVSTYPKAAEALKNDFYVDDLLTGANSYSEAEELRDQLIEITNKGGLLLRQWSSNERKLIEPLQNCSKDVHLSLNVDETTKTLGVHWNASLDTIIYTIQHTKSKQLITKRTILSEIAQLFDPLGLLGPIIVRAKIIMQSLWQLKLDWDESVPMELHTAWLNYRNQLPLLNELVINRKLMINNHISLQLHGFCDASEKAYGACIYIRSTNKDGITDTQLVCSKSRVAPLKSLTIARLELCAAVLLSKLFESTQKALKKLSFNKVIFWSDSTIALHWIQTPPHTLKTFVSNRVATIQNISHKHEWRHVRTEHNTADFISRGLTPSEFIKNTSWFNGPSWINNDEQDWPRSEISIIDIPEIRNVLALPATVTKGDFLNRFSSFSLLKRVMAYCLRFTYNATHKEKRKGILSNRELYSASLRIIRLVQLETFSEEIRLLISKKQLKGKLVLLNPFLDSDGILRVGGRLSQADIPYSKKHTALLPRNHHVTTLIIRDTHLKLFHAGTQATLNAIRDQFWIVDGKNSVKNVIHKCVRCCRAKPQNINYVMGNLPKNRVILKRAFLQCGVDYCGPFYVKRRLQRNVGKDKVYVSIFVCFATKAVHIEIVDNLTTESFLAAFKRFISRRGKCSDIYSDNATNFVGANREIKELYEFINSEQHVNNMAKTFIEQNINWHFTPPRSPHFGGLWEAAVKSFKYHMLRIVGDTILSYSALLTYTIEIEAILNSRPLTPLSSDPNDINVLTPGHFLIGDSLISIPEHDLREIPTGRLSSWQHVQQMRQHFWSRWNKEYLHQLTTRKKWHTGKAHDISRGTIVILHEDNIPPMQWTVARVIEIYPGADGVIRVVKVKTARGEYKRAVKRLSPLPIDVD